MIVGCGRCGTRFEAPGEGTFSVPELWDRQRGPSELQNAAVGGRPNVGPSIVAAIPAAAAVAAIPAIAAIAAIPATSCPACGFSFIVGDVDVAPCPNCAVDVTIRPSA